MLVYGLRNRTKTKVLIILYRNLRSHRNNNGLNLHALAYNAGVSHTYLTKRIGLWCKWEYISRSITVGLNNVPTYDYKILQKGIDSLNSVPEDLLNEIWEEMKAAKGGRKIYV